MTNSALDDVARLRVAELTDRAVITTASERSWTTGFP